MMVGACAEFFSDNVTDAVEFHGNQMADAFESDAGYPDCLALPFHSMVIILDRTSVLLIAEYTVRWFGEFALQLHFLQVRGKIFGYSHTEGVVKAFLSIPSNVNAE